MINQTEVLEKLRQQMVAYSYEDHPDFDDDELEYLQILVEQDIMRGTND